MKQKKIDFVAWTTIIDFWFGRPEDKGYGQLQNFWFTKDKEFDRQVRSRFQRLHGSARLRRPLSANRYGPGR